jgi:uncharacterized protein (DUF433 family)
MTGMPIAAKPEPWRRRLYVPMYLVGEAARYARISPQTVAAWHRGTRRALSEKAFRASLSYLQLIEVAVVAAFRKAGVSLSEVREARDFFAKRWKSEFPFAEYKFKTDGRSLFIDLQELEGHRGKGKLIRPGRGGQLAWGEIIGRLREFEYERGDGIVIRWHLIGPGSRVVIDPRVAFGAPNVQGTATWAVRGRFEAGESVKDICDDLDLEAEDVRGALEFDGIDPDAPKWTH